MDRQKVHLGIMRTAAGHNSDSRSGTPGQTAANLSISEIGRALAPYCREHGISRLEIFGSMARKEAGADSDVDLIATFSRNPGLHFFCIEEEMTKKIGIPVHLLSRDSVEEMTNPFRRESILTDAYPIYDAVEDRQTR
ncbi:MAG: nucleotidyltransferase domain-containing protein [Puniceicoccales bacterium]|jgi:predicted nucleotidyltransferase|nr:nucleotidyltransferase domain-containing protein [Puniceicoccales bacterium]